MNIDDKDVAVEGKIAEEAIEFKCEICDFSSNKESGLNIHMSRKHAVLEQIDGNIEQPQELNTEYNEEIEDYLKTGILGSEIQLFEDLLFYLK